MPEEREGYPALKQGVRIVADSTSEGPLQLTGVVDAIGDNGELELRCLDAVKAAALESGTQVTLEYFRAGVVYKLDTQVEIVRPETATEGPEAYPRVVLEAAKAVKKIQRRRFPRALVAVPVTCVPVEIPDDFDAESRQGRKLMTQWARALADSGYEASTETLSGSGLRMRTDAPVKNGDHLFVQIELPDEAVRAVGVIVWMGSGFPRESPGQALGLELMSLTDKNRAAILSFVEGKPSI